MLRAVLFDIDDTLYDFLGITDAAVRRLAARVERETAIPAADVCDAYRRILRDQKAQTSTAGYHSRTIRFQRLLEGRGLSLRNALAYGTAYWEELLSLARPYDGVPEALDALRAHGLRLGVGTNMTADWQLAKLECLGLIDRFDFMVSSEEAGAEKPGAALFALVVEKARCAPDEILFVGDNLRYDVFGAVAAGMQAVWLEPDPEKRAGQPGGKENENNGAPFREPRTAAKRDRGTPDR